MLNIFEQNKSNINLIFYNEFNVRFFNVNNLQVKILFFSLKYVRYKLFAVILLKKRIGETFSNKLLLFFYI